MAHALTYLTIAEASALLREGTISPVELTRAHLERIATLNDKLHAFITVTADSAMAQARQAEAEIHAGHYRGPLHGIPIAHKDIVWTEGVRTTAHSNLLRDWVPEENAAVFDRLYAAGAISVGKTALHEFACGAPGPDEAFPAARNPWHLDYVPGSSSSGSGAAVSAGLCMGATGTDSGGSIRHPAAVCGIVGLKPTFGWVSTYGVIPLAAELDHVGPMTRTVRDNAMMLQAMVGYDVRDPYSANHALPDFQRLIGVDVRGLRAGIPRRFIAAYKHDPEVLHAFAAAEQALREMGVQITEFDLPGLAEADDLGSLLLVCAGYRYHKNNLRQHPELYGERCRQRLMKGAQYSEAEFQQGRALAQALKKQYDQLFASGIDVIVSPGREHPANTLAELLGDPVKQGASNRMYNITGMPALTLPMAFNSRGLPLGLQIAGPLFSEDRIFQLAAAYETVAGCSNLHPVL